MAWNVTEVATEEKHTFERAIPRESETFVVIATATPRVNRAIEQFLASTTYSYGGEDGSDPEVLDIVAIEMIRPVPQLHQQENHLIDDGYYWVRQGTVSWRRLQRAVEDPAGPLWINGFSTWHGQNDYIPEDDLSQLNRSLYLVRPNGLRLITAMERSQFSPARHSAGT